MNRYRISRQAHSDLQDIWLYIAEDNPASADRVIDELHDVFSSLAAHPGIGQDRPDLAPGLRAISGSHHYLVFFRIANGVEIVRVLHGARDLPRQFDHGTE